MCVYYAQKQWWKEEAERIIGLKRRTNENP
jgi:hypothetical protein